MSPAMYGAFKRRPKTGRYSDPHGRFPESVGKAGEIERHLTAKDTEKDTARLAGPFPLRTLTAEVPAVDP